MFNFQTHRLLLMSTILSSIFSVFIIALTIYHHFQITEKLQFLLERTRDNQS